MSQFKLVALGGTFDIIHKGHIALLQKGFSISSKVIIGLTSDELATKKGKHLLHNYSQRFELLESTIKENFPNSHYEISKLDNDFGPAVLEGAVEALVVSEETTEKGKILNELRRQRHLASVQTVSVPLILAKDGKRISTTRIKNSEIDSAGNLC
jgi:pantetheine-phosphate adenylyltransferase